MGERRKAYDRWRARRTALLSAALAAVLALGGIQLVAWDAAPPIYAIALLMTGQIALLLGWLMAAHLRRRAPREASAVAVLCVAAAVVLTLGAPFLRPDLPARADKPLVVRASPAATEAPPPPAPLSLEPASGEEAPAALPPPVLEDEAPPAPPPPPPVEPQPERPEFDKVRALLQNPSLWQDPGSSHAEAVEEIIRRGWPSERDPDPWPSISASASLYLIQVRGRLGFAGGPGDVNALDGERTFQSAAELLAEFPLAPRDLLRVSFVGLQTSHQDLLEEDLELGDALIPAGSEYAFELQWAHLFTGFTHRILGYTAESRVDVAAHWGVMVNHLAADLEAGARHVPVEDHERGWAALALGFSVGLWDPGSGGLTLEVLQSLPVNIGGQTLAITDVRLVMQHDLSDSISLLFGYRKIFASFRTFDTAIVVGDSETESEFDAGGPLLGVMARF